MQLQRLLLPLLHFLLWLILLCGRLKNRAYTYLKMIGSHTNGSGAVRSGRLGSGWVWSENKSGTWKKNSVGNASVPNTFSNAWPVQGTCEKDNQHQQIGY